MSAVPAGARATAGTVKAAGKDRSQMPDMDRHAAGPGPETAAPHPEEMKATVELRLGNSISIRASARTTPAGLVATALLVSALAIPVVWLARARTRDHLRLN